MDPIHEGSSAQYTATVTDPTGELVPTFTAIYLTLYDEETKQIINDRHDQDVLNQNDVTINVSGQLTWNIQPEDTIIINPTLKGEWHTGLFVYQWAFGRQTHRMRMRILNYLHEPASSE